MPLVAQDLIDTIRKTTLDGAANSYSNDEIMAFLTEAGRSAANDKTDFYVRNEEVGLVAGELQTIPEDGVGLLDIPNNAVSAGGRVVTQVQRDLLKECSRFWPAGTRQAQVEHFTYDPRDPTRFLVFPPNNGSGVVQMEYGAIPPEITAVDQELVVKESAQATLVNYALAKCYAVSSKKQDLTKFAGYMNEYRQSLGLKTSSTQRNSPRVTTSTENAS